MPQPVNISGDIRRVTIRAARSSGTIPDQSRCPTLLLMASTCLFFSVERERVLTAGFDPVIPVEALAQLQRSAFEPAGQLRVVPDVACQASHPHSRIVGVALNLAGRDGPLCHGAVFEENRIPRVLPALVGEALF